MILSAFNLLSQCLDVVCQFMKFQGTCIQVNGFWEVLLKSNRESSRICHQRPMNIENSSTFVVDLDSLKHPDDVKKDEFGRWLYSGSHVQTYFAWKDGNKLKFEEIDSDDGGENTFQLRRICCKHPSNPQFQ